jgi:predicted transcriptional regulator
MTRKYKQGTYQEFKEFTLDVVKGKRKSGPNDPKIWVESTDAGVRQIQFHSLEAGAKLLSAKNRALLRLIAERHPKSISELALLAGRAEQNVLRTLRKLSAVGLVRFEKGGGRAYQPVVAGRKVHFEIDLLA